MEVLKKAGLKTLTSAVLLVLSTHICGQTHHIGGVFPTIDLKYDFNKKWNLESYSFLSVFPSEQVIDGITYPQHSGALYTELDLTYVTEKNIDFTVSYTYERANPFENSYRNENRIWIQAGHSLQVNKWEVKNRIRYDFRFISNRATDEVDFQPRVRYFLGAKHPIGAKSNPPKLFVYNEFFFNTFKDSPSVYGENWAFLGINFPLSNRLNLETGYLNISWVRDAHENWLSQHFAQITLIAQLRKAE